MSPHSTPPSLAQSLSHAQTQGIARADAHMLLLHALAHPLHDRAWLLAHDTDVLTQSQQQRWNQALQRRLQGEPVAYITGCKDFFGLTLHVDARVLDPRPDTEILVEWALELLPVDRANRVLDLGTGSGAVALALQHHRPVSQVTAVDASADALEVANANAQRLNLQVQCVLSHWADAVPGPFELIVSNPPYVAKGDPHLAALKHEPRQALVSGADGLDDIRQIIDQASCRLTPSGWLLLEHGWDQASAVQALLKDAKFEAVQSRQDLSGTWRCTGGQWFTTLPHTSRRGGGVG
jgi:release factor glutamine methyltransferase